MIPDRERLATLLDRQREYELRLPLPHERSIVDVAREAISEEIRVVSKRLLEGSYWRRSARPMAGQRA